MELLKTLKEYVELFALLGGTLLTLFGIGRYRRYKEKVKITADGSKELINSLNSAQAEFSQAMSKLMDETVQRYEAEKKLHQSNSELEKLTEKYDNLLKQIEVNCNGCILQTRHRISGQSNEGSTTKSE